MNKSVAPRSLNRGLAVVAAAAVVATTVLGLASGNAAAAPGPVLKPQPSPNVIAQQAIDALQRHSNAARAVSGQKFIPISTLVDADGATHVRMNRTIDGVPVVGGDVVVHRDGRGGWNGADQTLSAPLRLAVTPTVGSGRAAGAALAPARATRRIQKLRTQGEPRLVIDAMGSRDRLAWEVTTAGVRPDGTPSRLLTYVDAHTGRVVRREERIQTVDGSGESLYGGTVALQLTSSGSSYLMKDSTRGGTYTTDMNGSTDGILCTLLSLGCKAGTTFTSTDTTFGNGANSNRESAAVDAQYGTNMTWDYYEDVHGRLGIFGNGTGSYNRVHYGSNYVNAFWDGKKMTYGDGDGTSYGPLVSLDVAGHEMSHGVTENTAGLTYSGESGGLNEATSDIFGTMVEFHAGNAADPGDYFIGEEFDLANHEGLRRMDDPALDGSSQSCWSSTTKDVDVHYSSGVGNHFFYLLAEGSGQKTIGGKVHNSPTCDGRTVTGIGRAAAEQIWYRALTVYMTSGTNYAGARQATLSAAADLYGNGSLIYNTVAAAWSVVNVN